MVQLATTASKPGYVTSERAHQRLDELERLMVEKGRPLECPVEHNFVPKGAFCPGFYCRTIHMPKGALLTSKIHKTEHSYYISKGRVAVWVDGTGAVTLEAPHAGVTYPGTRRVLYVHEDCVWTTFHPTEETDIVKIEEEIIEPRALPALPGVTRELE